MLLGDCFVVFVNKNLSCYLFNRMRGMKALHSMVTVVEGVEAEVGAEVVDVVVEDTTEEG